MNIQYNHFATTEDALAEIKAAGYWPVTIDFPPEKSEVHWHDFDSLTFILEGELSVTNVDTGEHCVCGPGTRITAKAGIRHREEHRGYKALIGLSVDPAALTQPINKPCLA